MQKQLNIVLFGPPGAGKGTQSERIINRYHLTHISTGDLFRKHLGEGTALGLEAQKYMDHGKLVPDKIVIGMVEEKISTSPDTNGFIFDGFPRTVNQAGALDKLMEKHESGITLVIALEVDHDELRKRLSERGKVSGRADDENLEKINTRIKVYQDETLPVAKYYETQNKLFSVPGKGSIDSIFGDISTLIDNSTN